LRAGGNIIETFAAQFETVVDSRLDKIMQGYVEKVTKDLKCKGLIWAIANFKPRSLGLISLMGIR